MSKDAIPMKKASYNILYRSLRQPKQQTVKTSRSNQTKQFFILLSLIALVVLIPVLLITILNPDTIFETRRQAAGEEAYYGYVHSLTEKLKKELGLVGLVGLDGHYLANVNGTLLDTDPSLESEEFIIIILGTDTSPSLFTEDNPYGLTNLSSDSNKVENYRIIAQSDISANENVKGNSKPTVEIQEPTTDPIVGQELRISVNLKDSDSVFGDYIKEVTVALKYMNGTQPTWGMTIDPNSVLREPFPKTAIVIGTPTEEAADRMVELSITVIDILGKTSEVAKKVFTVQGANTSNVPPVIDSITCTPSDTFTFQTGCPTNPTNSFSVTCTINASDVDDDELFYTFKNVPNEFSSPLIQDNTISFSITKGGTPAGDYTFNAEVSDAVNNPIKQSKTISIQTAEVPCPTKQNPLASFTAIPSTGNIPLTVNIDSTSSTDPDGTIRLYKWSFGDGQRQEYSQSTIFDHIYNQTGVYMLTLEVIDNDGLTDSYSTTIQAGKNEEPQVTLLKPNIGIFSGSKVNPDNRIIWQVLDAEGDSPLHYEVDLLSATNVDACDFNSLSGATIYNLAIGNLAYDSSSESYYPTTFEWNTQSSLSGEVPDGKYCVRISISDNTYGHFILDYSDAVIEIINAEHPPVITTDSLPEATKGQSYSTQILAYDEDNDPLQFNLVYGPGWISINTEGKLFGQPTESGPFNIVVAVTDGKSERSRSYTLNVKATEGQILPAVTLSASAEVFIGSGGKINWTMINDQDVSTVDLEYSVDGIEWLPIATDLPKDQKEYIWDVSALETGKYYIRLVYYDLQGNKLGASDVKELEIARPETTRESFPNVFNFKPADGDKISDTTPVIAANFSPSRGEKVDTDTISIYLDNEPVTDMPGFEGFEGGFAYIPTESLALGEHIIKAGFKDTGGKVVDKKWSFTIATDDIVTDTLEGDRDFTKYLIAGGTIFTTALLTILAYFLTKKINEDKERKKTFAPKMFTPERKDKSTQVIEKIYKGARATLERTATISKPTPATPLLTNRDELPPLPPKKIKPTVEPDPSLSEPILNASEPKLSNDDELSGYWKSKLQKPAPIDALN